MKRFLPLMAAMLLATYTHAQITITAADMPVAGDKLAYSNVSPTGLTINPGDSGVNVFWNYALTPTTLGVDTFKTAYQVNPTFGSTISFTAIGYKVADSIPGLSTIAMLPITINDIYTYFQQIATPRAAYIASAYSFMVSGIIPTAANYTEPDVWYFFPLTYGNPTDSVNYALHVNLLGGNGIKEVGYRKTRVDGWGSIVTPYYTTPQSCIRVRSEIHEIDSVSFSGTSFGFPRNTIEYKWLINGSHYPALWVTSNVLGGNEVITTVRYRDTLIAPEKVVNERPSITTITAYPNPAVNGLVTLDVPADWTTFRTEVFDAQGRTVAVSGERQLNLQSQPSGQYYIRITSGMKTGYATVTR